MDEDEKTKLNRIIRYHEFLLHNARLLQAISSITLQELTVKYLEELKAIKEKG